MIDEDVQCEKMNWDGKAGLKKNKSEGKNEVSSEKQN